MSWCHWDTNTDKLLCWEGISWQEAGWIPSSVKNLFCELDRLELVLSSYDACGWQKQVLLIPALGET